jgi:hypothetical protein
MFIVTHIGYVEKLASKGKRSPPPLMLMHRPTPLRSSFDSIVDSNSKACVSASRLLLQQSCPPNREYALLHALTRYLILPEDQSRVILFQTLESLLLVSLLQILLLVWDSFLSRFLSLDTDSVSLAMTALCSCMFFSLSFHLFCSFSQLRGFKVNVRAI